MAQEVNPMQLVAGDLNSGNPNDNQNSNNNKESAAEKVDSPPPTYDTLEDTPMLESTVQPTGLSPLSVTDDWKAIVKTHFTKLDETIVESQNFHWDISNWSDLPERVESPTFEVGRFRWSILLFPRGNNQKEYVSIYVKLVDIEKDPDAYACAQFAIFLSRPSEPTNYQCQAAQHRFTQYASDWGFASMIPIDRLNFDSQQLPVLENNCIRISTVVQVIKDETGVLWHDFIHYDSKKITGFVGLKNQGATCYMNSLFQSLYCTNYFRKAVYQIPTDQDDPTGSIALAMQRLFYNLQCRDTFVDTIEVTKSFGWNSSDAFMQHDVQEFNRILQDTLETKMKANIRNTPADGAIKKLFKGRMKSYIKCINVDCESARAEDYYDIQLNVKGCKNLEESFVDYVAEEMMDGENKYSAEGHGLQDAKKGVIFESFPPVLHLQLKRFEYDVFRDNMVKQINDRHEFPLEIDLKHYLDTNAVDQGVSHKYILYGVLVHTGDLTGGHYFAFVKPTKQQKWLKFDDDRVVPATLKEVLEDNYGGEPLNVMGHRGYKRSTNAYMLVYIRESMQDEILADVSQKDIPAHLVKKFEQERQERDIRLKGKEEQHLYIFVQVITKEAFELNEGMDFVTYDHLVDTSFTSPIRRLRVRRDMSFGDFKELLSENLAMAKNQFRVWSMVNRINQTIRPDAQIDDEREKNTCKSYFSILLDGKSNISTKHINALYVAIGVIVDTYRASQVDFRVFIERMDLMNTTKYSPPVSKTDILIFIKCFDPEKQLIRGVGYLYAKKMDTIESKMKDIREIIGYEAQVEIDLYEEIKPTKVDKINPDRTFEKCEIQNGDIICVQKTLSEEEYKKLIQDEKYPTIPDYLDFLFYRIDTLFISYDQQDPTNLTGRFKLALRKNIPYIKVVQWVADQLDANPAKVQLFLPESNHNVEPIPIRPIPSLSFQDVLRRMNRPVLFYQVHDITLAELEMKRTLEITVCTPTLSDTSKMKVRVSKHECIADLLQVVQSQGATFKSKSGTRQPRVFEALNNKFHHEFVENDLVSSISDSAIAQLYAEEVPLEEIGVKEEDLVYLPVFHYQRGVQRTHSVPFQLLLKKDEEFSDTKKRLQQRTGMNDKDWSKVKFNIVTGFTCTPVQDHTRLWDIKQDQQESILGLDHIDKASHAVRSAFNKPLSIRG
ncbi:hypothetical protein BDA99DRAFT_559227 [Phascolomyces articulosus]|uniref:ubiquitinyl hydrolase 1 n=1 Tax=Phascolomyces articulosus TaxID=60185 RepID=A0AAD5K2B3_9FUNG|nr:hypothetical protein BDA99DRAFT_559227 [Phascolomyces articulosus]